LEHLDCFLSFSELVDKAKILDLHGRLILTKEHVNRVGIEFLSAGSYVLRLQNQGFVSVHRFVKE